MVDAEVGGQYAFDDLSYEFGDSTLPHLPSGRSMWSI
jgi:hypothetical protein